MAGLGFKDFAVGEVLTAADVDGYLMQQSVMRFADSAARGSALGTAAGTAVPLAEGMVSYLQDTNAVEVYDGSVWTPVRGLKQVVVGTDTTTRTTSSTTYVDASISVTITPTDSTSTLYLLWAANFRSSGGSAPRDIYVQITTDANVALEGAEEVMREDSDEFRQAGVVIGRVAAGSTSAQTFKGRFRTPSARVAEVSNASATGMLIAMEVAA